MATKKKLLQAAAGSAGNEPGLNVEELFSTYLWDGDGSTSRDITNNIDLSGEGGMVWIKNRDGGDPHVLFDTERGSNKSLTSNTSAAEVTDYQRLKTFFDDGFRIGNDPEVNASNGDSYASWAFRKAPKFFDVQTWSGNGSSGRTISHNLDSVPGMIVVKARNAGESWLVLHRYDGTNWKDGYLDYSTAFQNASAGKFGNKSTFIAPTSTEFTVSDSDELNGSGKTYVAYLFAHNDGDGDFGPDGDADIIKCGSYTGNGSTGQYIDVGFEPQWLLVKSASSTSNWTLVDNIRQMNSQSTGNLASSLRVFPSSSSAEGGIQDFAPTPTGWYTGVRGDSDTNGSGTYIYIAIRRGPMAVPTDATDVFAIQDGRAATDGTASANAYTSGFPVDLLIQSNKNGGSHPVIDRLRSGAVYLKTDATDAEVSWNMRFDDMDGVWRDATASAATYFIAHMWKRAPSFFDVVAFTSATSGATTVDHNLGVAPDMIWVKRRDSGTANWRVYHSGLSDPNNQLLRLNGTNAVATSTGKWSTSDTTFSINDDNSSPFIAYLFASLDGVSKVGSYTGNGTSQTIDCGFSSGARFVMIKRADDVGNWAVFDTERGIVSGNDPFLALNLTSAEFTSNDVVDPASSGFIVNDVGTYFNESGNTYIFYAIA